MKYVIGFLIIAYLFGLSPLCLGTLWNSIFRCRKFNKANSCCSATHGCQKAYCWTDLYVKGWLILLAGFWCEAIFVEYGSAYVSALGGPDGTGSVKMLSLLYLGTVTLLNIPGFVMLVKALRKGLAGIDKASEKKETALLRKLGIGLSAIYTIISVLFVRPINDEVIEHAMVALSTDTMYVYDPFWAGMNYGQAAVHRKSPIEILWAVAAYVSRLDVVTVVKYLMPSFALLFFFAAMWQVGEKVLGNRYPLGTTAETDTEEEKGKVTYENLIPIFYLFVLILMSYPLYVKDDYIAGAILTNPCNGLALLNCIMLPYAVSRVIDILRVHGFSGEILTTSVCREGKLGRLLMGGILLVSAQLMNSHGAYYVVLIYIFSAIAMVVKKVLAKQTKRAK